MLKTKNNHSILIFLFLAAIIFLNSCSSKEPQSTDSGKEQKTTPRPSAKELQGIWQPKEQYVWDSGAGQFAEIPISGDGKNPYIEFKENQFCIGGEFDDKGMPVTCQMYVPFKVDGDTITVQVPNNRVEWKWGILDGKLELLSEDAGLKTKLVLIKPKIPLEPESIPPAQDPKLLIGLWKTERAFDKSYTGFEETREPHRINSYQEFREDGTMCRLWTVDNKCNGYKPYFINGNKLKVEPSYGGRYDVYIWQVTSDGKLEIVGSSSKSIYAKVQAIEQSPVAEPSSPKVDGISVSAVSIKAGDSITITCTASDDVEVSGIDFNIVGAGLQFGWRFNPEQRFIKKLTAQYTHKLEKADTYTVSCNTFDDMERTGQSETMMVSVS